MLCLYDTAHWMVRNVPRRIGDRLLGSGNPVCDRLFVQWLAHPHMHGNCRVLDTAEDETESRPEVTLE